MDETPAEQLHREGFEALRARLASEQPKDDRDVGGLAMPAAVEQTSGEKLEKL
jgi:hypothetical protein